MERSRAITLSTARAPLATERSLRSAPAASAARTGNRVLSVQRVNEPGQVVLYIGGFLDVDNVMELRDIAFTLVGERPTSICLDVTSISYPLDAASIQALVTICRVAKMVKVNCGVRAKSPLSELLKSTGLERLLPLNGSGGR